MFCTSCAKAAGCNQRPGRCCWRGESAASVWPRRLLPWCSAAVISQEFPAICVQSESLRFAIACKYWVLCEDDWRSAFGFFLSFFLFFRQCPLFAPSRAGHSLHCCSLTQDLKYSPIRFCHSNPAPKTSRLVSFSGSAFFLQLTPL